MSAVPFLDLPNEILGAIFSHLSNADLLNVSLACKRFYTVAQPMIYHTIDLSLKPIPKPDKACRARNPETIHRFWSLEPVKESHTERICCVIIP